MEENNTDQLVNEAVKVLTVAMVQSKIAYMKADTFSDGEFYVLEVRIRKVTENE